MPAQMSLPGNNTPPPQQSPPNSAPPTDLNQSLNNNNQGQSSPPDTQDQSQTPPTESPPEVTAASVLEEFEKYTADPASATQNPRPPKTTLNKNRKFDGLADDEKVLFDQMSNQAYEKLYPAYLKSKEQEQEIATLKEQLAKTGEVSFYDQEGAWQITPEYKQLSGNLNNLQQERQFWQAQLGNIRDLMSDPEKAKTATIDIFEDYDDKGNAKFIKMPVNHQTEAIILSQLSQSNSLITNVSDKLNGLQGTYKGKHSEYVKGLNNVRDQLFKGYPTDKLKPAAEKKLQNFPDYVRNRPEVKMLSEVWVLVEALLSVLNKQRAGQVSNQMRNNTIQNSGPRGGSNGSGAGNGVETPETVAKQFKEYMKRM